MMEITLCRHNEIKGRCRDCRHDAGLKASRQPSRVGTERACADCAAYAPVSGMTEKPDGRVICSACQKAIEAKAQARAQGEMFVTQPALF